MRAPQRISAGLHWLVRGCALGGLVMMVVCVSNAVIVVAQPDAGVGTGLRSEVTVRIGISTGRALAIARVDVPAGNVPRPVTARTDDGRVVPATLARMRLTRGETATGLGGWAGCEGQWVVDGPGSEGMVAADAQSEQWVVAVRVGADGLTGHFTIDELPDIRVEVVALGEVARGETVLAAAAEQAVRGANAVMLGAMLSPAAQWPSERWRVMTIMRAMDPSWVPIGSEPASGVGVLRRAGVEEPLLEAFAAQTAAEWSHALGRVAAVDEALAARLARTLLGLVRFEVDGHEVHAPVWPAAADEVALRTALLEAGADDRAIALAASTWLETRVQGAVAWVVDDAGRMGPERGESIARIGAANLRDCAVIAWASTTADAPLPEELEALPGHSARCEDIALGVDDHSRQRALVGAGPPLMQPIVVHIGGGVIPQRVASSPRVVLPPGLTIGPLLGDWTMASWLSGAPSPPVPTRPERGGVAREDGGDAALLGPPADAWATAAKVFRAAEVDDERAGSTGWSVMVQANVWTADEGGVSGGAAPLPSDDFIEVWFGATGKPSAVVQVRSDGRAQVMAGAGHVPEQLPVRWTESRSGVRSWRVSVPVPASAVERGERLRIALVRVDARGVRSAWPRAMMPWQREPGRALLDLGGWDAGVEVER